MNPIRTPTHAQEREQFRELLATYSDEARVLPSLKPEDMSPNWLRNLQIWWREQMTEWWEWLRELFGVSPETQLSIDWVMMAQIAFWLVAGVGVGLLIYVFMTQRYLQKRPTKRSLSLSVDNEASTLQRDLDRALAETRWGLAARLRWRLFLTRLGIPPHITPREFFIDAAHRRRWEQAQGSPVGDQYRMMFAGVDGSRQWFDHYHGALTALEGEQEHA